MAAERRWDTKKPCIRCGLTVRITLRKDRPPPLGICRDCRSDTAYVMAVTSGIRAA